MIERPLQPPQRVEPANDDREDELYDAYVQRLVDAEIQGEEAGLRGDNVGTCPYYGFEKEFEAWHRGRLRTHPSLRPVLKLTGE